MSATKDILIDMEEYFDMDFASISEQKKFQYFAESKPIPQENRTLLDDFLQDIMPDYANMEYYAMISGDRNYANLRYQSLNDLAAAVSAFSKEEYNVFFSPAAYAGWRCDKNVNYVKSLFVDIDDLIEDTLTMSADEITYWLMDKYNLPADMLPNWVVCSGHGLHLYYVIDTLDITNIDNYILRSKYINSLIYYFQSDAACCNLSRIMRVPFSFNIKKGKKQTKLYHINKSTDTSISRLDFFPFIKEDIDNYFLEQDHIKAEKRKATMQQNGTIPSRSNPQKSKAPKASAKMQTDEPKQIDTEIKYRYDYYSHARAWNIIIDLNNYYVRRNGNITGRRNIFCYIMSVYYKLCEPDIEQAKIFILPYFDDSFKDEAAATIKSVYQYPKKFRLTNRKIALFLDFSREDYEKSYCNYTPAQQQQARRESLKRSRQKQLEKARMTPTPKMKEKDFQLSYAAANMATHTNKELAADLGISVSTVKRLKKQISIKN